MVDKKVLLYGQNFKTHWDLQDKTGAFGKVISFNKYKWFRKLKKKHDPELYLSLAWGGNFAYNTLSEFMKNVTVYKNQDNVNAFEKTFGDTFGYDFMEQYFDLLESKSGEEYDPDVEY
jgi:hypothetical protein